MRQRLEGALLVAVVGLFAGAVRPGDDIRCRSLTVEGPNGRAMVTVREVGGSAMLSVSDPGGVDRVYLMITKQGWPVLTLNGADEKARVRIGVGPNDLPQIALVNPGGELQLNRPPGKR